MKGEEIIPSFGAAKATRSRAVTEHRLRMDRSELVIVVLISTKVIKSKEMQ
jgi:hypothetical protein